MVSSQKIRVRLAPSPTGFLHVGTAQSALYNWLFAKKNSGEFLLRIEDTDKERSTKGYEQSTLEALEWLGLDWKGKIIRQSERHAQYRKSLEKLISNKKVFWCNHSKEELEAEKTEQIEKKLPPRHICNHRHHYKIPISSPERVGSWVIRLAVDHDSNHKIIFNDEIRGLIEFETKLLGDFSIAKNLDEPLYNLAVVIDDIDMEISHVIRGEDHISNTPKQILIYEALGLTPPTFAHLPLILAADRSKLSKRHGAVAVVDYKKDYLPEALINFLGCLGYTFSKEMLSAQEMIGEFELDKVHKAGAVFDIKKLNWYNAQYIKKLSVGEFRKLTGLEISDAGIALITERLEKLTDVQAFTYLWMEPIYSKELLCWKDSDFEQIKASLGASLGVLKDVEMTREAILAKLERLSVELGNKGLVFWPLRVALSGKEKSPGPVEIAIALGKEESLKRIQKAIEIL